VDLSAYCRVPVRILRAVGGCRTKKRSLRQEHPTYDCRSSLCREKPRGDLQNPGLTCKTAARACKSRGGPANPRGAYRKRVVDPLLRRQPRGGKAAASGPATQPAICMGRRLHPGCSCACRPNSAALQEKDGMKTTVKSKILKLLPGELD
jgi:hypothetical protein